MKVLVVPYVKNFTVVEKELPSVDFSKTHFRDLRFKIVNNNPSVYYKDTKVTEFDFIWLSSCWETRDIAYALSLYLQNNEVKHTPVEKSGSKMVDHMIFGLNDIAAPNTFFANTHKIDKYIEEIEETCGYPMIVKETKGSRGRNTFLVRDRDELNEITKEFKSRTKYIYQSFVENEYDWGVLVSNGKVVSAEKSFRTNNNEFRNHAFRGAKEVFVDVDKCPEEIKEMAINAAEAMSLDWCRADIIVDRNTGNPYMLEINRYPGITKKTDEADAVINYVKGLLNEDVDTKLNYYATKTALV